MGLSVGQSDGGASGAGQHGAKSGLAHLQTKSIRVGQHVIFFQFGLDQLKGSIIITQK